MISKEEVLKIAKLARLELADKEVAKMQKDLSSILDYFNLLKTAKKVAVENEYKDVGAVARTDVAQDHNSRVVGDMLKQAPDRKDDYFKVKSIL